METEKRKFFFDKVIFKYQSLSEKEKFNIDIFIKVLALFFAIVLIYNAGRAVGEYLFNVDVKI